MACLFCSSQECRGGVLFPWDIFPRIAAVSWAVTIYVLLAWWLLQGRPILPSLHHPHIAYISDAGAYELKPFFIAGAVLTAAAFLAVNVHVHLMPLRHRLLQLPSHWFATSASITALVTAVVSAVSLVLLTVVDTYRYLDLHCGLLYMFCAAMMTSAVATAVSEWHPRDGGEELRALLSVGKGEPELVMRVSPEVMRKKQTIHLLMAIEIPLCFVFLALWILKSYFAVGVLEWIIATLLVPYLWLMEAYIE